jgi:signal transduction histidine kinase
VVAGVRRRNLIVSFGILLVLGLSVVMTVVATQRAQRLARAEVEFVAGVSHELSTPLSVICVAGENLADGLLGGGKPVRRYGALVRDEGRRLRELVDQVLVFSTPGTLVARRERVDLRALVAGALEPCRTDIEEQRFEVRTEIAAGLPLVVGDEAMLRRAVQNLLSNAIKYSGSSRRLCVLVGAAPPGHGPQVWLTVRDEGLGIDPVELPRIFEPFYRSREARARQIRGSGLGLSLVRRIAEQHGGRVTVESEPGHGSSFTIRLPASEHARLEGSPNPLEGHEQAHPAG